MIYDDYKFKVPEQKMIRVITDTDAKNEADDQYAIVHTLLSPRFDNRGIIAAHFGTEKSPHTMMDSYHEAEKLLELMRFPKEDFLFKGAEHALSNIREAVPSEGVHLIIKEALKDDPRPLYVTFLGPLTDLASAYLMEPRIASRLTAIWIGGGAYPAGGSEYNISNDIIAANIVMRSSIPLWQVPRNVYSMMRVSMAELEYRVRPCGKLGEYLVDQLVADGFSKYGLRPQIRTGEVWILGDSPVVGLLLCPQDYDYTYISAPDISSEMAYIHTTLNRPIRVYNSIDTRFIFEDFYAKLAIFDQKQKEYGA